MKLRNLFLHRIFRSRDRQHLVRSYFFVSVILIAGGLISAGLLEIYFRYMEGLEEISLTQQDAAAGMALRIERFIQDIATTMKAVTKSPDLRSSKKRIDYEFELKRLFFLAPAITEALVLDTEGIMQAEFRVFALSLLSSREISRNQLPSSNQVRADPISGLSISEITIHTSPLLFPLSLSPANSSVFFKQRPALLIF